MLRQIRLFLGPARLQVLFWLLALTGLGNLLLNAAADESDWAQTAQTVLVAVWLIGTVGIIGSRLDAHERGRWIGILVPAFGVVLIGVLFFPQRAVFFMGAAFGWIVAGLFLFKPRGPMEYQRAVKLLRKNDYAGAVKMMDELIRAEPNMPQHYRFRAELFRVWGKLDKARRDYAQMTRISPDSSVAWNGLAEVELQAGQYTAARQAGLRALELAPGEWVAAYNLGMIEDRLQASEAAIQHLEMALAARVKDERHRVLIHLYRVRAYRRLGQIELAQSALVDLKKERRGLGYWDLLLDSNQAETLKAALGADVDLARQLIDDQITLEQVG